MSLQEKLSGPSIDEKQEVPKWTQAQSDVESIDSDDSYDPTLEWTEDEENRLRRKIDFRLMSFVLLCTFIL